MIKKVDHATLAVKDMDRALATFEKLLQLTTEGGFDTGSAHDTRLAMLPTAGGARIELVSPDPESRNRFAGFLEKRGEGVFGISVFIDGFDDEVKRLKEAGIPVEEVVQNNLFPGNPFKIAWIPDTEAHGVWIELVDWDSLPDFEK